MSEWKQAWNIALIEMKMNKIGFLLMAFFSAIYLALIILTSIEKENSFAIDLLTILLVWIPMLMRGKAYTAQKVGNGLYASRFVILLLQFPLSKEVIIKSRFVLTFLFNVCFNMLLLTILYFTVAIFNEQLSGLSMLVFIMIWLGVGYLIGAMVPASEIGTTYSTLKLIIYSILWLGFLFSVVFIFQVFLKTSFVDWTIYLANERPTQAIIGVLILTILAHLYGNYAAKKAINQVDYYL
ncbi:MAG TPA: hypothetical protein GX525_10785 [Bacilli bacterium]|nr:hypothetical protein [Bacilli bacterium]